MILGRVQIMRLDLKGALLPMEGHFWNQRHGLDLTQYRKVPTLFKWNKFLVFFALGSTSYKILLIHVSKPESATLLILLWLEKSHIYLITLEHFENQKSCQLQPFYIRNNVFFHMCYFIVCVPVFFFFSAGFVPFSSCFDISSQYHWFIPKHLQNPGK